MTFAVSQPSVILEMQDRIAVVTLNRPAKRNAFHEEMWGAFAAATEALRRHPPRVIVLTGAGDKAFSAGFDVNPDNPQVARLVGAVEKRDRDAIGVFIRYLQGAIRAFTTLPVPVVAALNGMAYGGGAELAVQCDLRVMDESAVICFSETRLGLMPDWGGGVALTRLCGPSIAADLILTGRKVGRRRRSASASSPASPRRARRSRTRSRSLGRWPRMARAPSRARSG
jgi:enoyl-CoA hydratase/carnithine racemase